MRKLKKHRTCYKSVVGFEIAAVSGVSYSFLSFLITITELLKTGVSKLLVTWHTYYYTLSTLHVEISQNIDTSRFLDANMVR